MSSYVAAWSIQQSKHYGSTAIFGSQDGLLSCVMHERRNNHETKPR